jgi:uncharacterized protein DUF3667
MKQEHVVCKNCKNTFKGNYCNICGQDAHTGKIDGHFLVHEVQHGLFHVDKGILFTFKELFSRPGYAIREFIDGKRVRHFKPLSFLIITAGLYAFIYHFLNAGILIDFQTGDRKANNAIEIINEWTKAHYLIAILIQLPLITYFSYLVFKKYGNNYAEQLVINTYLSGQRIIVRLVLLPLLYIFSKSDLQYFYFFADRLIPMILFIWVYKQYYFNVRGITIIWRAALAYILFFIMLNLVVSIALTLLANIHQ